METSTILWIGGIVEIVVLGLIGVIWTMHLGDHEKVKTRVDTLEKDVADVKESQRNLKLILKTFDENEEETR